MPESTPFPPFPPKPEAGYRVLHTADWHLGKLLGTLEREPEQRRFLAWLEEAVVETGADVLVIAGDVFDTATPPQSAVRLYFDFLAALHARSRCQVVVTAGNHDSPAHLEAARGLLGAVGVHVLAALPRTAEGGFDARAALLPLPSPAAPRLVIAALPFLRERDLRTGHFGQEEETIRRELREGIAARYREAAEAAACWGREVPVLATGHLTALGSATSESEREIHVGGLGAVGVEAFPESFAYVALGHLHRPQAVGGRENVRYSGSPLALSFGEVSDVKEVRLLDFHGAHLVANVPLSIPAPRALLRLETPYARLRESLLAFEPPQSELEPWVEVIVTGAGGRPGLFEEVCAAAKEMKELEGRQGRERRFQIIRVLAQASPASPDSPVPGDEAADHEAEALLSDPRAVFLRRLEREPPEAFPPSGRETLVTAFDELCTLLEERRREMP